MRSFSRRSRTFSLLSACLYLSVHALAAPSPVFIADLANPNDFDLFANSGWDGNWYVGYNNCWIQKLSVPEGSYARAFIGAKLGRMKGTRTEQMPPWEKTPYPGEISMGISKEPSWSKSQTFMIAKTSEIPLEGDAENAVDGVGESRWFWKEIPMKLIEPGKVYYAALWSPTRELDSISNSPALAAGWGNKDVNSWLANDIKGSPPGNPEKALSKQVTVFEPAIALKLIPACPECGKPPKVSIAKVEIGKARGGKEPAPKVVWAHVNGETIERAWVEVSGNKKDWSQAGRTVWDAPFAFTIRMQDVTVGPEGRLWVRVLARDVYENEGISEPVDLLSQ